MVYLTQEVLNGNLYSHRHLTSHSHANKIQPACFRTRAKDVVIVRTSHPCLSVVFTRLPRTPFHVCVNIKHATELLLVTPRTAHTHGKFAYVANLFME